MVDVLWDVTLRFTPLMNLFIIFSYDAIAGICIVKYKE